MRLSFSTEEGLRSPMDNATKNLRELCGSDLTFTLAPPFVRVFIGFQDQLAHLHL